MNRVKPIHTLPLIVKQHKIQWYQRAYATCCVHSWTKVYIFSTSCHTKRTEIINNLSSQEWKHSTFLRCCEISYVWVYWTQSSAPKQWTTFQIFDVHLHPGCQSLWSALALCSVNGIPQCWYGLLLAVDRRDRAVIKWKHFPRNWPFVLGIHRSPGNSPYKGQWRGALMFSLICVWINDWVNNRKAGHLRRYRAHYGVIVMYVHF